MQSTNSFGQQFVSNILPGQNYSNFIESNQDFVPPSPLFPGFFLSPTPSGSFFPVDLNGFIAVNSNNPSGVDKNDDRSQISQQQQQQQQSANHQYEQYQFESVPGYYYPENQNQINDHSNKETSRNKNKTTNGLGRRIGELVSNSAEKATRAFKSFPKLLNDIKPSKLLGLSPPEPDFTTPRHNISSIPPPSNWYSPQNTWSSFAPPPISSNVFFQQPVFVRTNEMSGSNLQPSASIQSSNQIIGSPVAPVIKSSEFTSNINPQFVEIGRHPNVYPNDMFASAQTSFGTRVKPPRDQYAEYNGGSSEDLSRPADSDDTKMANEGIRSQHLMSNENNDDRMPLHNHSDGPTSAENSNENGWQSNQSYDEYADPGTSDFYPTNYHRHSKHQGNEIRRPAPNYRPSSPLTFNRRPYSSLMEFDETDNWYSNFFGPNVKPMNRLRNVHFNNFAPPSTILSAPSSPNQEYMPYMSFRQHDFYPAPVGPRPWSYNFYPNFNPNYFHFHRPNSMIATGSMMRPVTMPFYPAKFIMPSFRPYIGAPYNYPHQTPPVMSSSPIRYPPTPFNSLMSAASSLYPIRVPFPPIGPPLPYGTIIPPPIHHIPMLRHRIGTIDRTESESIKPTKPTNRMALSRRNDFEAEKNEEFFIDSDAKEKSKPKDSDSNGKQDRERKENNDNLDNQLFSFLYIYPNRSTMKPSLISFDDMDGKQQHQNSYYASESNQHRNFYSFNDYRFNQKANQTSTDEIKSKEIVDDGPKFISKLKTTTITAASTPAPIQSTETSPSQSLSSSHSNRKEKSFESYSIRSSRHIMKGLSSSPSSSSDELKPSNFSSIIAISLPKPKSKSQQQSTKIDWSVHNQNTNEWKPLMMATKHHHQYHQSNQ